MVKKIRKKPADTPSVSGKSRTARANAEKNTTPSPRQKDQFGFMEGTDSSIAAHALHRGGSDRVAIYEAIREDIESNTDAGLQTRNGTEKNIPNLVATVVKQMRNRGWIVESTWRMVLDPEYVAPEVDEPESEDDVIDQADIEDVKADEAEAPAEDAQEPAEAPKRRRPVRRRS